METLRPVYNKLVKTYCRESANVDGPQVESTSKLGLNALV